MIPPDFTVRMQIFSGHGFWFDHRRDLKLHAHSDDWHIGPFTSSNNVNKTS